MKIFMESHICFLVPYSIQEVVNFISFFEGNSKELVGFKEMDVFMFFVDNDEWNIFH